MPFRLLLALLALTALAQEVRVYSELQRIDPFGKIVPADRAERPREILSPPLPRNGFASFEVAVTVPEGKEYSLFIGQNPENAVQVALYKQDYIRRGDSWIPDGLEPLKLSDNGQIPAAARQVPGQTTLTYWMDVWVSAEVPPLRRTRLELQLYFDDRWIIYPLELRVMKPVVAASNDPLEPLPPVEASASNAALAPLHAYICGNGGTGEEGPLTVRSMIRRNARQDVAIARSMEPNTGKLGVVTEMLDSLGAGDRKTFCEAPAPPRSLGAEWYLRLRDYLYRTPLALSDLPKPTITAKPLH